MALRTYGDKPVSFQIEENGEYYCIGSEVRNGYKNIENAVYVYSIILNFTIIGWKLFTIVPGVSV